METLYFDKLSELKRSRVELEQKLGVTLTVVGRKVTVEGTAFEEYEALIVLEAIKFGFSAKKAVQLKDESMMFVKMPIKQFTRRKNLREVRGRVIGREGKTKRTIESIANCDIIVNNNEVGILGDAESIEEAKTALTKLIGGAKESNVYNFLERMNAERKKKDYNIKIKEEKQKKRED